MEYAQKTPGGSYDFSSTDMQSVPNFVREGFVTYNSPTEDVLNIPSRPIEDFIHNNMVPFFGSSVKQNMSGTGVDSDPKQESDYDTSPHQKKLEIFTGIDSAYLHKRAVGPLFSPAEQQTSWVNGMPAFRPPDDRYTQTMTKRNDLAPCEREMVGPGIGLDTDIPASGGFHDFTRVLPNNVNDYKANQLEGRVKAGKFQLGGGEPMAYPGVGLDGSLNGRNPGIIKNKPDKFWTQERYPTMTTHDGIQNNELLRPDYNVNKKPGNATRDQTNYGFGELVLNN